MNTKHTGCHGKKRWHSWSLEFVFLETWDCSQHVTCEGTSAACMRLPPILFDRDTVSLKDFELHCVQAKAARSTGSSLYLCSDLDCLHRCIKRSLTKILKNAASQVQKDLQTIKFKQNWTVKKESSPGST